MDEASLRRLLDQLMAGDVSADDVVRRLRRLPYADLGFARVDHHRALRQGLPEAVYGPGKSPGQCVAIVGELLSEPDGGPVVLSRATEEQVAAVLAAHPNGKRSGSTLVWRPSPARPERVAVLAAGTADLAVAEECKATLEALGLRPTLVADCGVAGVHRLLEQVELLEAAEVVVVIAGMEGALASLVGGLTGAPVVAVPTSAGYGASFQGLTALLAMMASCAPGVCVVGIDNGFGAAWAVGRILGSVGKTARHVPPTGSSPTGVSLTGVSLTGVSPTAASPPSASQPGAASAGGSPAGGSPAGPSPTGRDTPAIPSLGDKLVRR